MMGLISVKRTMVFVFGTRPELIKMVPLILEAKKRKDVNAVVCSTGQHREMLESLYSFFGIQPDIDFKLMKPNQDLISLHSETMSGMARVFEKHRPDWVVVQGDTTSAHAAAMAAFYQKVPVAHVEAGLRTYDIHSPFPEEMNRRAIGLVAKAHLCPTREAADNLKQECIDKSSMVEVTGNTGIDTLHLVAGMFENTPRLKAEFEKRFSFLAGREFILTTMHRRENFGSNQKDTMRALLQVVKSRNINILFPAHPNPNVRRAIEEVYGTEIGKSVFWADASTKPANDGGSIFIVDPLEYPALVYLMKNCRFVMTDSGGLQEEAPSFGKKLLVLRTSTERPEGVKAGFSQLVGVDPSQILTEAHKLIDADRHWMDVVPANPYGDGKSSVRIMDLLSGGDDIYLMEAN
jgi:UDP-N-acetylglucosamine 2-epimerase (non-hydrolysing)